MLRKGICTAHMPFIWPISQQPIHNINNLNPFILILSETWIYIFHCVWLRQSLFLFYIIPSCLFHNLCVTVQLQQYFQEFFHNPYFSSQASHSGKGILSVIYFPKSTFFKNGKYKSGSFRFTKFKYHRYYPLLPKVYFLGLNILCIFMQIVCTWQNKR